MKNFKPEYSSHLGGLLFAAFLTACGSTPHSSARLGTSAQPQAIILVIAPRKTDCNDGTDRQCMQVKQPGESYFHPLQDSIEGFTFREGSRSSLFVRVEPLDDHSAFRYSLIEVLKSEKDARSQAVTLENSRWRLQNFVSPIKDAQPPLPENFNAGIEFQNGQISGSGGCNRFFGTYLEGAREALKIQIAGSTLIACPEPEASLEKDYLLTLSRSATYRIADNRLELHGENHQILSTYRTETNRDLAGPTWKLHYYNNGSALESNRTTTLITAQFDGNGKLSGFSGCNGYFAGYQAKSNGLKIESAATTRRFCSSPGNDVMRVEQRYLHIFTRVAAYSVQGNRLTLYGNQGSRLAAFTTED
jgi:heat shock protein HslJ